MKPADTLFSQEKKIMILKIMALPDFRESKPHLGSFSKRLFYLSLFDF